MRFLSDIRNRLDALRHGPRADRELQEELAYHLDMSAARFEQAGVAPDEARRRARAALGGVAQTREAVRDASGVRLFDDLVADLKYAFRQLRRSPAFTAVAVATLALGIGVNTAIYSVINGVLLRPVPFRDPGALVMVWETDRQSGTTREPSSWPDYEDFTRGTRTLSGLAAIAGLQSNLTQPGAEPRRLTTVGATSGYFALMGIRPLMGRTYTDAEDGPGGANVILLGESLWRREFAANPAIVGSNIRLDDSSYQVIGILPAGADFALDQLHARAAYHAPYTVAGDVDAWMPLRASSATTPRQTHPFLVVGRLAPRNTVATAQHELETIAAELERTYPENKARGVHIEPLERVVFGAVRPVLLLLLGAVALVLLVACVNVANLLLARGAARTREVAVRGALGASLGRLSRQFAVEAILLTLFGAVAGVALAWGGLHVLLALAPADIPRVASAGIDLRVLGATLAVSLIVGIAFGLVPTSQAFHVNVTSAIKGEGGANSGDRGRRRFREFLVVTELAMSVMLVACAGLLVHSFWSVLRVDPGFRAEGVLKAEYQLPPGRYPANNYSIWPKWNEIHRFNDAVLTRVRALPGVEAATIAAAHPLDAGFTNSFTIVGREAEAKNWPEIRMRLVTSDYFKTMNVALREGRVFDATDDASAPFVAVLNEAAVKQFFPSTSPLGQEIRFWGTKRRIVGVVGNERIQGLTEEAPPAVYAALGQAPMSAGVLLARTSGDPTALENEIRAAIRSVDPELALFGVEPLSNTMLESVGQRRFATLVLGTFAAATLFLALVGVHGVLSYTTSQRTREIGIRVALGATSSEVTRMVLRGALGLALTGVVIGIAGAFAGSSLLASLLFGVTRLDPLTYIGVTVLVVGGATFATWLPARRAARVQPTEALRAA